MPNSLRFFASGNPARQVRQFFAAGPSPWRLVVLVCVLALGICGLGWWAYSNEATHLRHQQAGELQAIADFKAQQIAEWLAERRGDAKAVFASRFTRMDFSDWLSTRDAAAGERLRARLEALQVYDSYVGIELLDRAGISRLTVGSARHPAAEATPEALSALARAKEPQLVDLHRDEAQGPVVLAYLLPVFPDQEKKGEPLGYMRLTIDPQKKLYPLIQSWPTPSETAETLIVRLENGSVVYLNKLRHAGNTALDLSQPLTGSDAPAARAIAGAEGIFEGRDYRGVAVLSYLRGVPGTPWRMVAKVDRAEMLAEIQTIARAMATVTALLLFSAGLVLWNWWRRQHMSARLAFRQELEKIAEVSPGVIHSFLQRPDGSSAFPYASPAIREVYGYGPEQLAEDAAPVMARIHPEDGKRLEASWKAAARHLSVWQGEFRYHHPDKGEIWVEGKAAPMRQANGGIVWYGSLSDITERKEAQRSLEAHKDTLEQAVAARTAQLVEVNDRLKAFTYAASHDLKAPLRGISGFSDLLEASCRDKLNGDELAFLDHIRTSTARMAALIDDLLEYARQEQQAMVVQPIDLAAAVRQALLERQDEIQRRKVQVRVDLPQATVNADRAGLNQVLRNLVDNALKYTANADVPQLDIGGEAVGDRCRLWVRDNGIGFDMAYRDKIFEIFQRLHSYSAIPGSGVGLALVKKAVEAMHGRIWAESAPGRGATFFLEIPLAPASGQGQTTA